MRSTDHTQVQDHRDPIGDELACVGDHLAQRSLDRRKTAVAQALLRERDDMVGFDTEQPGSHPRRRMAPLEAR
jgi:hypothetical protein